MKAKIILMGLMIFFTLHIALATEPTIPTTITPSNNAILFNAPQLHCSGSTDPDGDPINITFAELYQVNESAGGSWTQVDPGTSATHVGTDYGDPSFSQSDQTFNAYMEKDVIFLTSEWRLQLNITFDAGCGAGEFGIITIDGDEVFKEEGSTDYPTQNDTIDVSSYADGSAHTIKFLMDGDSCGGKEWFRYWWDANQTIELSSSSNTTYNWSSLSDGTQPVWTCRACDNTSVCSNYTSSRQLNFMEFEECASGNKALTFNIKDEVTSSLLNANTSCQFTLSSADDSGTFPFEVNNDNSFNLCLNPTNIDATLNGFVTYEPTSGLYNTSRQYNFADDVINGNNTQVINLYSLKDTDASLVLIHVKDRFGNLLHGAKVTIQRYIDSAWLTISELITDPLGRTQGQYVLNTAYYNHVIEYDGNVVFGALNDDSNKLQIYTEDVTNGITFNIDLTGDNLLQLFQQTYTVNHNITYTDLTNTTGFFSYSFFDTTGKQWTTCLEVIKGLNPTDVCTCGNNSVHSNTGVLTCNTNQSTGRDYYLANAFLYNNETSTWLRIDQLALQLGEDVRIDWGATGFILAFFLVLLITFVFLKSPTISILLGTLMFVLLAGFGVIFKQGQNSLSWGVLIVIMVIGYLVARLKSEGGQNG